MLISSFLFTSVALAGRPRFHRQSLVSNASSDTVPTSSNWAGALYELDSGSFNFISGVVTVPHISGPTNSSVSMGVGIDGLLCPSLLAVGVEAIVTQDGPTWCHFNGTSDLDITISAGDLIQFTVVVLDKTSGLVILGNRSNGRMAHQQLQSSHPLCGLSASWYIELVTSVNPTTYFPLANFGKVTFTDAVASDPNSQSYGPQGAHISETVDNGTTQPLSTSTSIQSLSSTCSPTVYVEGKPGS